MIATREIPYDVDGLTMVGHLARPDGEGPWPAVLIGHDGIGLDDYQRRRADHLAELGYLQSLNGQGLAMGVVARGPGRSERGSRR